MNASLHAYWRALANGEKQGTIASMLTYLLLPAALIYGFIVTARAGLYKYGILKTHRLPRPVISIGNITVGGTGKTPTTIHIAQLLISRGFKVAVISRGYGGNMEGKAAIVSDGQQIMLSAGQCGDEPYLMAASVPGLIVAIGSNRYQAGQLVMETLKPDVFLLDDGFQHMALHRDLNILLADYATPFGNGLTLPAGVMREPKQAAERADLVILTRSPEYAETSTPVLGKTTLHSRHILPDRLYPLNGDGTTTFSALKTCKVFAFAGIAEPGKFFKDLAQRGLHIVETMPLPDHSAYDATLATQISERMQKSGADLAITTEKDGVKLAGLQFSVKDKVVVTRLSITTDPPDFLEKHLFNLLQK